MTRAIAVLAVTLALVGAGCSDPGPATSAATEMPSTAAASQRSPGDPDLVVSTGAPLALGPTQASVDVGAVFDWGAFRMTVGHVVHDRELEAVAIGVRVQNSAAVWRQVTWPGAALVVGDRSNLLFGPVVDLPPGASVDVTLTAELVAGDPLAGGVFHLGAPANPSIDIPLTDRGDGAEPADTSSTGRLFLATPVAIDAWAGIGKYTIHVTSGTVMSSAPEVLAEPQRGARVLRVRYDLFAIRQDPVAGFGAGEHLRLRRPDGETVEPLSGSDLVFPTSWSAFDGLSADFEIGDEPDGDYELELSSISPKGLVPHPELIERVAAPFTLVVGTPPQPAPEGSAVPDVRLLRDPTASSTPATPGSGSGTDVAAVDRRIDLTANPVGFLTRIDRLTRSAGDPEVRIDVEVTSLKPRPAGDDPSPFKAGSVLAVDPQFSPTIALITAGQIVTGTIDTADYGIPPDGRRMSFTFLPTVGAHGQAPSLDDATLVIGNRTDRPAYVPLGPASPLPLDPLPPLPDGALVEAPPIEAGDFTVDVTASRIGLFAGPVPVGKVQLQLALEVTAASDAVVKALGLGFRPEAQVFLARPDGYLTQPVETSSFQLFEPGQTFTMFVVFEIDDGLLDRRGGVGTHGVVIRSRDESGDIPESFIETTAPVALGT